MIEEFQIDELFEQATEDASHYLWAVESWSDPPEGYETDYVLMLALAYRARSRLALELIDSETPTDYKDYKELLENIRQTAERELNEIVLNDSDRIERIVSTQLIERLNAIEELLQKVSKIAQDGDLMEDPEWMAEDLRETAHDFVFRFQLLTLVGQELNQNPFDTAINSKIFQDHLKAIDLHFQHSFGYFHAARDIFPGFKKREYGRKDWWLNQIPEPDDLKGDESLSSLVEGMKSKFRDKKAKALEDCPMADKVTAYAFDELDLEEGKKVREHIHNCRDCLNMLLDLKIAEDKTRQQDAEIPVMYQGVQNAIGGRSTSTISFFENIKIKISGFLQPLLMPKTLTAVVTASLVVLVSIYALWEKSEMPPKTSTTIEILLLGKRYGGLRGGEAIYEEFKQDKTGILKSGDFFRVQTRIDRDEFVYVVFHDSTGKISGIKKGYVKAGEEIFLPDQTNWYQLDNNTGEETIYVVASENEISDFDGKVQKLRNVGAAHIDKLFPEATIQSFSFKHE